jgi:hypothetical protein
MIVELKEGPVSPVAFKPIEIRVKIETASQLYNLQQMAMYDSTIPDAVDKRSMQVDTATIGQFLRNLRAVTANQIKIQRDALKEAGYNV